MDKFLEFFSGLLIAIFPGLAADQEQIYAGYVEADYVYVASVTIGRIKSIPIVENQLVIQGYPLFELEDAQQRVALAAVQANLDALKSASDNIQTGARTEELSVVRAQLVTADINEKLSMEELDRDLQLLKNGVVTNVTVERARAALSSASALVSQLRAQLVTMELPARTDEILKAEANVQAAVAEVEAANLRLEEQTIVSPVSGRVESIFFSVGEVATIGVPVVSILPDGPRSVIFYISETQLSEFTIGEPLQLSCDGCETGLTAVLSHVDAQPEFTPPLIYSRDERSRLVYRAEAELPDDLLMRPGQPVSLQRQQ